MCLLAWVVGGGGFRRPRDPSTQEILSESLLWALNCELDSPSTEPTGLAPGCQRRHLLGLLEEEEKGIGIASDVVKVSSHP